MSEWTNIFRTFLGGASDGNGLGVSQLDGFFSFFGTLFTIIPPGVLLAYLFVIFLLIIFNTISPTTPKFNVGLSLFFFSCIWLYFSQLMHDEFRLQGLLQVLLYVIIPVYGFSIIRFIIARMRLRRVLAHPDQRLLLRSIKAELNRLDNELDQEEINANESERLIGELQRKLKTLKNVINQNDS